MIFNRQYTLLYTLTTLELNKILISLIIIFLLPKIKCAEPFKLKNKVKTRAALQKIKNKKQKEYTKN